MSRRIKWSLLGISDHQGVIHVGGRIGASGGPLAFREEFDRLNGRPPAGSPGVKALLEDFGDLHPLSSDIQQTHRRAAEAVTRAHLATGLSVVVGGGHDHGYSHLLGLTQALAQKQGAGMRLGCINIDAHLDVRKPAPLITSGSPFYLAIESKLIQPGDLVEFGIQSHCNGPALWEYAESKGVEIVEYAGLRNGQALPRFEAALSKLASYCDAVAISFDLDAVASAFAPGVSAPAVEGFSSSEALSMMEISGRNEKVVSLGIFELNPEHDRDAMTAKLAAVSAFHFIAARLSSTR